MNSISKLLVNRYWFRLLLSICLSVTATLFGVSGNFFWMGLSIGALIISICGNHVSTDIIPAKYSS